MQEKMSQDIQSVIERAGGVEAMRRRAKASERVFWHFCENEATYLDQYPGKWIVVTLDGVAFVGDDLEEAVKEAHKRFAPDIAYHIEFMDPEPKSWIL